MIQRAWASDSNIDLDRAAYGLNGVKYIDLVSLVPFVGLHPLLQLLHARLHGHLLTRSVVSGACPLVTMALSYHVRWLPCPFVPMYGCMGHRLARCVLSATMRL